MKHQKAGIFFIMPWFLGLILFTLFPLISAVYIGFTDWNIASDATFIGFENYQYIFSDPNFWNSLWVTVRYAIFSIPISITIAFTLAYILSKKVPLTNVFRVVYYLPAIVSGAAVAVIFKWILNPSFGLINGFLNIFGILGPDWLGDPNWVLPSYLVLAIWGSGSGLLIFLAAIKDVPKDLYEAARIDGANRLQTAWFVTTPLVSPIIFYSLIIGLIGSFRKFTDAFILGGAGNQGRFLMVYLYELAFSDYSMGRATAVAWILFVILISLTLIVDYSKKYWVHSS